MPPRLYARSIGRRGDDDPLVLVHGFTQTGDSWGAVAQNLARDHRVVLVDLPGHGRSGALRAGLRRSAELLGEAAAASGPATFIGYSMGARVCLHLALEHPERVRRLVLVGATAGIEDEHERLRRRAADEARAEAAERDGVRAFLARWMAQPLFAGLPPSESTGDALAARLANTADGLASSLRLAGTGTQEPQWSRLPELVAPTLVLAGDHDTKFSDLGRRLVEGIGSNASFQQIPGAGHAAHLEQPEAFLSVLRRWLGPNGNNARRAVS